MSLTRLVVIGCGRDVETIVVDFPVKFHYNIFAFEISKLYVYKTVIPLFF